MLTGIIAGKSRGVTDGYLADFHGMSAIGLFLFMEDITYMFLASALQLSPETLLLCF